MRTDRFQRLLASVHPAAIAFARGLCRSHADADDLFQEAAIRALVKIAGLRDDAAFRTWFFRVLISVHRNRCRRAFWSRFLPLGGDQRADGGDNPEEVLGAAQRSRLALAGLPPDQREAIVLFEIDGWTVEQIADVQDVSVSAVKSRLARGRERLRIIYTQRLGLVPSATPDGGVS